MLVRLSTTLLLCCFALGTLFAQSDKAYAKAIKKYRKHHIRELLKEERAPIDKKMAKQLAFFDPNSDYAVEATFTRTKDAESFDMATYSGITKPYVKYGTLSFELDGNEVELAVYQSLRLIRMPMYRDYLFLPFKDATNGALTYGGGRYLDLKASDIVDGKVQIDLNKVYNPYCAYSDGYNCPIPPQENHLTIEVLAGEKAFVKD
jgi:uncharacterized protein (DUF1684 family)